MSRPDRRAPLSIAIAAFVALAAPAAAQAATYTVAAGGDTCGGGDLTCETLAAAAAAVGNGDTVNVEPGQYGGANFTNSGLEIAGTAAGVVVNGSVNFSSTAGGVLRNMSVLQSGPFPAIGSDTAVGLEIRDAVVFSAGSDAVLFVNGTANKIVRSVVITGNGGGADSAVRVNSEDAGNKALRLESTLLRGGFAGVRAVATGLTPGDIAIEAHHLTAAGSTHGLSLEAVQIGLGGAVSATIDNSITLFNNLDPGLLSAATLTPNGANITSTPDKNAVFADPSTGNYRLKPGSPAIGAGGAPVGGESTTDIDGDDRSAAPTDLGADEYTNIAPTARIAVKTQIPRDGQPVQFDGGGSTDQPGGGIATYHWDFGDGKTQTTTTPTVAHTYTGEGTRTARLAVKDGEGVFSGVASTSVKVVDGTAPAVLVTTPKSRQKIDKFVKKTKTVVKNGKKKKIKVRTKKRTRLKFKGTATDKSGVFRVYLIVERTSSSTKRSVAQGRQSTSSKRCRYLDPKKGMRRVRCNQPIFIVVKLKSNSTSWSYTTRKSIKFAKGTYKASLYGLDKAANFGNAAPKADRNVTFRIR